MSEIQPEERSVCAVCVSSSARSTKLMWNSCERSTEWIFHMSSGASGCDCDKMSLLSAESLRSANSGEQRLGG